MQVCPSCGEENPPKFRLCGYCGAALAAPLPAQEERKVVTVFFSDLKGSTSLGENLDPESLREVMTRYFDVMTAVLQRHGATIEKFIGAACSRRAATLTVSPVTSRWPVVGSPATTSPLLTPVRLARLTP